MTALPGLANGKLKDQTPLRQGPLARALEALNGEGEETRLVGGAVRDLALGEPAVDFDLTTTATTDEVIRRARRGGVQGRSDRRRAWHGDDHRRRAPDRNDDAARGRRDRRAVGQGRVRARLRRRRAAARFHHQRAVARAPTERSTTTSAASRISARDGCASSAMRSARIREDYLRILRFFRFSARFAAGGLDRDGLSAAIRARDGLARLSRERVRAELMKLLVAPRASEVVQTMGESGFLEPILGGVGYPRRLSRLIAIEAERGAGRRRPPASGRARRRDPGRRGAAARPAASRQRRSRPAESRRRGADRPARDHCAAVVRTACGRSCSTPDARPRATRSRSLRPKSEAPLRMPAFAAADRFLADTPEPKLPISGADLIARGVAAGRPVGQALRALQALWIRAGFPKEPDALTRLLEEAVAETARNEEPEGREGDACRKAGPSPARRLGYNLRAGSPLIGANKRQ